MPKPKVVLARNIMIAGLHRLWSPVLIATAGVLKIMGTQALSHVSMDKMHEMHLLGLSMLSSRSHTSFRNFEVTLTCKRDLILVSSQCCASMTLRTRI